MKHATSIPAQPSIARPANFATKAETRTSVVATTSEILSKEVAFIADESISLPILR